MLIVIDTNVLVSAVMGHHSPTADLLNLWEDRYFDLVTSEFQIDELLGVLTREKIARLIQSDQAERLLKYLVEFANVVEPVPGIDLTDDPADNVIIGTALGGGANYLVSGDKKHLLPLGNAHGVPVISPSEAIPRFISIGRLQGP